MTYQKLADSRVQAENDPGASCSNRKQGGGAGLPGAAAAGGIAGAGPEMPRGTWRRWRKSKTRRSHSFPQIQ